jgi:hypothetical protein
MLSFGYLKSEIARPKVITLSGAYCIMIVVLPCDIQEFQLLRSCPGEVLEEDLDIFSELVLGRHRSKDLEC